MLMTISPFILIFPSVSLPPSAHRLHHIRLDLVPQSYNVDAFAFETVRVGWERERGYGRI